MVNKTKPSYSPKPQTWFDKCGVLEILQDSDGSTIWRYTIEVDGVPTTVNYIDGVADFGKYADEVENITLTGNRADDFVAANKAAGLPKTPEGFTWHHDMPCGKMVLIPTNIHSTFTHQGGFSLCGK